MRRLLRSRSARIAGLALLAVLSLVPLPLLALPYGSLDWVVYDPAYREGHSWPVPPGRAPALEIPCAEFPEPDEPLVAVVNGLEIGRAAFQREMDQFLLALQAAGHDVSGEIQPRLPEFRRQVLELMIEDILIQQAAVELGIGIDEESIAAQVAAQVEQGGGLELFQLWLEQTGQTWEEFRRDTCQDLLRARVEEAVGSSAAATVEMVQARQIVVPSQEDAVRVLIRLASGEPFADVAREASVDDATREQGGDLGWFFRGQGVADAQVEALAFAGQPGQVKGPVAVPEGYVIVQTVTGATQQVPDPETRASLQALAFLRSLEDRRQGADVQVLVDVE
jgi:parvulin-like peptidyl-prolyl isomerase